jgi:GNAT superfamily N-acetyltransferase
MEDLIIREGKREDVPALHKLVAELARYERAEHELINTVQQMEVDGFGEQPLFHFLLAELNGVVVGISLYYFRYSTWKGKVLYLEDLVVTEALRKRGIGEKLFQATVDKARELNCGRMSWQVLDWNEPAIKFYGKWNIESDGEWINMHLEL